MRTDQEREHAALDYIESVTAGSRAVGKLERLGVERHVRDLACGRALRFNPRRALRAMWWIERHLVFPKSEWAGKPFVLEPWQAFIVWALFGWERWDGERWIARYGTAYITMARKNAKSTLAAAIGLLMLVTSRAAGDGGIIEHGAEVYSAATKRDQAAEVWRAAASMIRRGPENSSLKHDIAIHESRYNLSHAASDSRFEAMASEADTLDGLNPYGVIVDELHAHPTSAIWDVLESGTGGRRESLQLGITTAGAEREGLCWDLEQEATAALYGVGEETGAADDLFVFIARLDEGDDAFDESVWLKANPNLGVSVHLDKLRTAAATAKRRPSALNEFLRKRMNLWTEGDTSWMPPEVWDACDGKVDLAALKGQQCWLGADLSATTDTTALVAVWRIDGKYFVHPWVFVPEDTLPERHPREREMFGAWIKAGLIEATPGAIVDYDAVWERILHVWREYGIHEAVFDQWGDASFVARCENFGIPFVRYSQGYKGMDPAMKAVDVLVRRGALAHGGNPVLRAHVLASAEKSNATGKRMLSKKKSIRRIDAAVAMLNAMGRAEAMPQSDGIIAWRTA